MTILLLLESLNIIFLLCIYVMADRINHPYAHVLRLTHPKTQRLPENRTPGDFVYPDVLRRGDFACPALRDPCLRAERHFGRQAVQRDPPQGVPEGRRAQDDFPGTISSSQLNASQSIENI